MTGPALSGAHWTRLAAPKTGVPMGGYHRAA